MVTFNKNYFAVAMLLFITEVLIALFVRDRFVRPYFGDVLVVILIYTFIKSFFDFQILAVALGVLIFSFTIEFLQFIHLVEKMGLDKYPLAITVLGNSFAWNDVIAYVVGAVLILFAERSLLKKEIV